MEAEEEQKAGCALWVEDLDVPGVSFRVSVAQKRERCEIGISLKTDLPMTRSYRASEAVSEVRRELEPCLVPLPSRRKQAILQAAVPIVERVVSCNFSTENDPAWR